MRNKVLGLAAAAILAVGCECAPDQNVNVAGGPVPGSPEDFKANIKDRVFFAFDRSDITPESERTLEAQAGWLKTYGATRATISGHCDARGTREYNLALGARRAHAAKRTLVGLGVDHGRMRIISYGKDEVLVPGDTEEAYAQNRVAVTTID